MIHSSYLSEQLNRKKRAENINLTINSIRESGLEFDAVAFTGVSGALIAPSVADILNKDLLVIRKNGGKDQSHSSMPIEGSCEGQKYIIVDDQITSGATVINIIRTVNKSLHHSHMECIGIFLYQRLYNDPKVLACIYNERVPKQEKLNQCSQLVPVVESSTQKMDFLGSLLASYVEKKLPLSMLEVVPGLVESKTTGKERNWTINIEDTRESDHSDTEEQPR